jgi:hypothetical protein
LSALVGVMDWLALGVIGTDWISMGCSRSSPYLHYSSMARDRKTHFGKYRRNWRESAQTTAFVALFGCVAADGDDRAVVTQQHSYRSLGVALG